MVVSLINVASSQRLSLFRSRLEHFLLERHISFVTHLLDRKNVEGDDASPEVLESMEVAPNIHDGANTVHDST